MTCGHPCTFVHIFGLFYNLKKKQRFELIRAESSGGSYSIGSFSLWFFVCGRLSSISNDISSEATGPIGPKFYM